MAEFTASGRARTEREHMVASQLARRGVTDERVLEAMREVPREAFVGAGMKNLPTRTVRCPLALARPSRSRTLSR